MRGILRLCLVTVWLIAALLPAGGASVIFYSKTDNSYGWCAGYSYGRGESCAREQCLAYGSGCELAIECDGYWSATAFAPDPYEGFGASCEWPSAGAARGIALLSCIYASHTLCSTSAAFDGNARSASESANGTYDLGWYTQSMLLGLGYDIGEVDGEIGSRTRSALADFQSTLGLEPTGEADWTMMGLLLFAYGGTSRFVGDIIAQTDAADQHIVQTYAYRYAGVPAADLSLAAELAGLEDGWRRTIVAALVARSNAACTLPASAVGGTDAAETWTVSCLEGDYLLSLGGPTPVVTHADGPVDIKPLPVACPTDDSLPAPDAQQQVKPSPNTLNGPPPESTSREDCLMTQVLRLKPSPNTVNSKPPTLGNLVPIDE